MMFDFATLATPDRYKILGSSVVPRPIAWITTLSADGIINAAPYSFFNVMGSDPPTLAVGMLAGKDGLKDTPANIVATEEFVVNLVSEAQAEPMNITCIDAPANVDELALAGLTALPSAKVKPPRIAGAPVSFECKTLTCLTTGPNQMIVIGEVLCAHVDDRFVLDAQRCHLDTTAMGLVGRMHGGGWYARTTDLFSLDRPSWASWPNKPE